MEFIVRFAGILCLGATLGVGGAWRGALVNSKCYDSEERNVNPTDTLTSVDRDRGMEIRYCTPNAKTKSFAVVDNDGASLKLDAAGNAKAAELVKKTGKKSIFLVEVTGHVDHKTLRVDSISLAR